MSVPLPYSLNMAARSVSVMALPPEQYERPRGAYWKGSSELERFPPSYPGHEDVFDEYLSNKSLSPNKHGLALKNSTGLMELHYDTMRKKQRLRAEAPSFVHGPTMTRSFQACPGYGGFIPGRESCNIVGVTHAHGSRIALDTRGSKYDPPMSGVTFHIRGNSRSQSLPYLSGGFTSASSRPGSGGQEQASPTKSGSMARLPMNKVARDP